MRRLLIATAAIMLIASSISPAHAARRNRHRTRSANRARVTFEQPRRNDGFFSRLMEVERRKNAALARMFGLR